MSKNMLVTCAGFGGSGSSAITDILKEFKEIKSLGDFEFTVAHELDGLSDLEYYIVDNKHRLNVDAGIYRFKDLISRINNGYSDYILNFNDISQEYINDITELKWNGHWHNHEIRYSKLKRMLYFKLPTKIQKVKNKLKKSNYEIVPKFKTEPMFFSYLNEEEFLIKTKKYTNKIIRNIKGNDGTSKIIAMDQLVAPNDIKRYSRYFENLKVIVIDRDPRDLYLLNEMYWKEGWIPSYEINTFIKWFKKTRECNKEIENNKNTLYIRFENLIYNYDFEVNRIYNFLNIKEETHINKKKYFNPEISVKNTRLWNREDAKIYSENIKKIENELKEFC
ncbi:TPA: sulfotransferase family protein [Clostridium perfringens]|uniref:sulfotransferase family protein n=1 Tax=Clostridium perfringens TaxID=1502 RepID=UPI001241A44A|nr:sulfotransferase family protein [Clostridium perfringens]MDU2094578.1 sulfotransferase family protein [Clostridium perfringens]MDU2227595.1 sulfotransferase family protein [Clostridium perfringens]MDU4071472.1 sulfotransferase family protein [Clostridium perfringens]MDU4221836.1 sulfotransferase family protein [Clostridium perfringens]